MEKRNPSIPERVKELWVRRFGKEEAERKIKEELEKASKKNNS